MDRQELEKLRAQLKQAQQSYHARAAEYRVAKETYEKTLTELETDFGVKTKEEAQKLLVSLLADLEKGRSEVGEYLERLRQ